MKSKGLPAILLIILTFNLFLPVADAFNARHDVLTYHPFEDLKSLLQSSDVIGYGSTDEIQETFNTNIPVSHGKLVNTVQSFQIETAVKGPRNPIKLLVTGVEPLPRPRDPLNDIYPGPLATGHYILFLKKIEGTDYFQLTSGWQSVYPIIEGKSVALHGTGFDELNQLSVTQFLQKLKSS